MTLLTVVQGVCSVVGVNRPTSIFSGINANRTMQEMLDLANEMAQRIGYDGREWGRFKTSVIFTGDGSEAFSLPANYKRMLLTTQVWRSTSAIQPMRFFPDFDEWLARRQRGYNDAWGEWTIYGGKIHFWPVLAGPKNALPIWQNSTQYYAANRIFDADDGTTWQAAVNHVSAAAPMHFDEDRLNNPGFWVAGVPSVTGGETARLTYLDKNCIALTSGGAGDAFMADDDTFLLDERLLRLGMIWQWKAQKGSPYAEDMANFQTALSRVSGADKPAPIIVDRLPISASARIAYPFPIVLGNDGQPR